MFMKESFYSIHNNVYARARTHTHTHTHTLQWIQIIMLTLLDGINVYLIMIYTVGKPRFQFSNDITCTENYNKFDILNVTAAKNIKIEIYTKIF